jgi:hypothetical protein
MKDMTRFARSRNACAPQFRLKKDAARSLAQLESLGLYWNLIHASL